MADSSVPLAVEQPANPSADAATNDIESGVQVYITNLPYVVTDTDLRVFVEELVSDVVSCQVETRETSKGTRSNGSGFVTFTTSEAAQQAVTVLDCKDVQGRQIRVRLASDVVEGGVRRGPRKFRPRYYWRGDGRRGNRPVPREATEADAVAASDEKPASSQEDKENRPEVEQPAKYRRFKGRKKSYAAKPKASLGENGTPAESGGEASGATPGEAGKPRKARRFPRWRRAKGEEPQGIPSTTTLFVANLPFSLDDNGLAALFTEAGFTVNSARVVRRRWGQPRKSKGYGFVDVGDEEQQKKAMEALQGKELEGERCIAVKVAVNPKHDEDEGEAVEEAVALEVAAEPATSAQ